MRESTFVNQWKAEAIAEGMAEGRMEGMIETRQEDILLVLEARFPGQVPAEWVGALGAQADPEELARWFDLAALADSPAEFEAASGIGRGA